MINPDRNLYEPPYDDALLYDSDLEPERPRSRPLVVLLGIVVLAAFAGVVWVAYNQGVKQGQLGTTPVLTAETTRVPPPGSAAELSNVAPAKDYTQLQALGGEQGDANIGPGPEEPRTMPSPQEVARNTPTKGEAAGGTLITRSTDYDTPTPVDPRMDSTTGPLSGAKQVEDITPQLPPVETPGPVVMAPKSLAPAAPATIPSAPKSTTATQTSPATQKSASTGPKIISTGGTPSTVSPPSETKMAALAPELDPAPAPKPAAAAGSIQIQLGSFPSDALAASAWSRIKSSNQDVLGNYSPAFERAEVAGKGTWYRLRVGGFPDKSAAADVCETLKANGQACIIAAK